MTYVLQHGFLAALWPCFCSGAMCSSLFVTTGASHHSSSFLRLSLSAWGTWHCFFFPYTFSLCFLFSNCELLYQELLVLLAFFSTFFLRERKRFSLILHMKDIKNIANIFNIYLSCPRRCCVKAEAFPSNVYTVQWLLSLPTHSEASTTLDGHRWAHQKRPDGKRRQITGGNWLYKPVYFVTDWEGSTVN